jgi:hypothetical protein
MEEEADMESQPRERCIRATYNLFFRVQSPTGVNPGPSVFSFRQRVFTAALHSHLAFTITSSHKPTTWTSQTSTPPSRHTLVASLSASRLGPRHFEPVMVTHNLWTADARLHADVL